MDWMSYHPVADMHEYMAYLRDNNDYLSIVSIGQSYEGNDMQVEYTVQFSRYLLTNYVTFCVQLSKFTALLTKQKLYPLYLQVLQVCRGGCGNKPAIWIDGGIHARYILRHNASVCTVYCKCK